MKLQFIAWPGFTMLDLVAPLEVLTLLPKADVQIVGRRSEPVISDSGAGLVATHSFEDAWDDADVLMVPGGAGTIELLHDYETVDFVADRGSRASWVTSVCTGSLILGVAGLLRGYNAASYWYTADLLARFGAVPQKGRVVVDRNRVTGGGVTAGLDFGLTLLGMIESEQFGRTAELLLEYAPEPPFGSGTPELADVLTRRDAEARLQHSMPKANAPRGVYPARK